MDPDLVAKFSLLITKLNACVNHLEQFPIKVSNFLSSCYLAIFLLSIKKLSLCLLFPIFYLHIILSLRYLIIYLSALIMSITKINALNYHLKQFQIKVFIFLLSSYLPYYLLKLYSQIWLLVQSIRKIPLQGTEFLIFLQSKYLPSICHKSK